MWNDIAWGPHGPHPSDTLNIRLFKHWYVFIGLPRCTVCSIGLITSISTTGLTWTIAVPIIDEGRPTYCPFKGTSNTNKISQSSSCSCDRRNLTNKLNYFNRCLQFVWTITTQLSPLGITLLWTDNTWWLKRAEDTPPEVGHYSGHVGPLARTNTL